ncbi:hypothetical protein [Nocardia sp. NPDC051832]|uniref:hypothetical protein n=1 Tax=Nocardia sp. NPDC051832 TaxID=3155673 RepID=UPI0034358965
MKPIDSGNTGVIAPQDIPASESLQHAAATSHEPAVAAVQSTQQAVPDVPLGQWPADVAEPESPALVYARKLAEDQQNAGTMPAGLGLGGLTGQPIADTQNLLNAVPADVSSLLSGAQTSITAAAQQAQTAATSALTGAGSALTSGELQKQVASIADTAGLSSVLNDPATAVNSLLNGASLSALPGVDQLLSPILELLSSFGSGVMGALDPTAIMSSASSVIESAMEVGQGAITSVQQLWEGTASEQATIAAQQANTQGTETSQRGFDISDLTQKAAAVVQTGNTQLTGIATSFASQAVAMAPVILTPPGQAALVASATEHLGNAVSVVNATRGDLSGKTTELNAMLQGLLGQSGLPSVQEVAETVAQNVAEPLSTTAQEAATQAQSALTSGSPSSTTTPASTNPSAVNTAGTPGTTSALGTGTPRGTTGTPRTGTGSGNPSTGNPAAKAVSGVPGTVSPLRAATVPTGLGTGLNASTTPAGTGNSFMGNPAGAANRGGNNDDDEHDRNVTPYQSLTGNDDLTGPLGESTPDVIGATHSDEMLGMDYEQDQF